MHKNLHLLILLFIVQLTFANGTPVLVTESTVVLNFDQSEDLFFSFAEGDIIEIDFEMVKGKHLKAFEVYELPNTKLFSEFKATRISKKQIQVKNKGLYRFRFYNSSLGKRVCKVKISRIPGSAATQNFNTNWRWETIRDTIYTPYTKDSITGYNTVAYKETVKELANTQTIEDLISNKNQRVHSALNGNGNFTSVRIDLPRPIKTALREEKVIAWAYWIGVGEEAQQAYAKNVRALGGLARKVAEVYTSPLGGLAVGALTELAVPKIGEDVTYTFIPDYENVIKFTSGQTYLQYDTGKGIAAYGKNSNRTQGTIYIGLHNDNQLQGIDVEVKIVVIKEIKTFEMVEYDREKQEPIIVTLNKTRMHVKTTKIRVPVE